ncbi:MAG TPA: hypothetical protein PKX78_00180 [Candidatus Woesebacteria bacterium]|nr:hypothetical protein [Candidatus Woesebacteria bacterium]
MNEDEILSEKFLADVESVKIALQKLSEPQLESVNFTQQTETGPSISAVRSYFDVQIDPRLIPTILTACGYPPDQQQEISIVFRAASIADRNFHGGALGGIARYDEVQQKQRIEIYTSMPWVSFSLAETVEAVKKIKLQHYAFKKEQIVSAILEEIRHAIQRKLHLFEMNQGSFLAQNVDELRKIDCEAEADAFVKALVDKVAPFVEIKKHSIAGLNDIYLDESEIKMLLARIGGKALPSFLERGLVAQVIDTDPVGLLLVEKVENAPTVSDEEIDEVLKKIEEAFVKSQIGFVESRWLFNKLITKLRDAGNEAKATYVQVRTSSFWS